MRRSDRKVYALKRVSIRSSSEREVADALNEIRCAPRDEQRTPSLPRDRAHGPAMPASSPPCGIAT